MKLLVNNKAYDLTYLTLEERRTFFKTWKEDSSTIECNCIENRTSTYPALHVKQRPVGKSKKEYTYFIANNPNHNIQHDSTCPFNHDYKKILSKKGINLDEEGLMSCSLSFQQKKRQMATGSDAVVSARKHSYPGKGKATRQPAALKTLFMALLEKQESHIDTYRPNENRRISKRLYAAARKAKVGKTMLYTNKERRVYFASFFNEKPQLISNRTAVSKAPFLVVGWGRKDEVPETNKDNSQKVNIPLYSVDDPNIFVTNLIVYKSTFEKAKERILKEKAYNGVLTGYWVLWRDIKEREGKPSYFEEKQLLFIPAESVSRIPVDSLHEEALLKSLIIHSRSFKKPLIESEIEEKQNEIRPDFILTDTQPQTVIEVAGLDTKEYLDRLEKKRSQYIRSGYQYAEWFPGSITLEKFMDSLNRES